ncbi:MAG: aminotransferase class V-fold PLP-dependent enzyme [Candidatus Koribacter versatilis]|uniref:Aminotransferase class V-fold PLP-dependent enzyme n=1 Tax=Candidatus Korobacter versatilis TaxID=658062 RepID=A0A932A8I7_9BACT|nr:aminotransferase class V-fold PLP-dependent enzyme [Candidatus Koribacter versatilis]
MLDRRSFLRTATGVTATMVMQSRLLEAVTTPAPPLPPEPLFQSDEEAYWTQVRQQFLIPPDEVYLNNGTVGSSPRPVLQAIFKGYEDTEKMDQADPEDYPIWGYGPWNEFRDPLAEFVGCTRDEIALVRNSTEANSYIANGIDMKPGDEVLMSDQEHPSGLEPWRLRAKRYGIVVKQFQLPKPPKALAEIMNRLSDAITPRTRIIFVSHVSTVTGVVLPVKEICVLARSKGILSAIDGAHTTGMMKLNIRDFGCDMFASSPHKWLQAPKGSGYLFVREEVQDRIWNTIVTAGWDDPKLKAERFQRIGSSNVPALYGLREAVRFARLLGIERIERRHRKMADYILGEMVKRGAESWTSSDPAMRCGIATVNVPPIQRMDLENWLWKRKKIRIRGGEPSKLRLSTPYYLLKADVDRFLAAFDEYKAMKKS